MAYVIEKSRDESRDLQEKLDPGFALFQSFSSAFPCSSCILRHVLSLQCLLEAPGLYSSILIIPINKCEASTFSYC